MQIRNSSRLDLKPHDLVWNIILYTLTIHLRQNTAILPQFNLITPQTLKPHFGYLEGKMSDIL